jgi:outer membrane protein
LSTTRQNLAKARYDTIISGLRLKAAAGTLTESDLNEVNAMLSK